MSNNESKINNCKFYVSTEKIDRKESEKQNVSILMSKKAARNAIMYHRIVHITSLASFLTHC